MRVPTAHALAALHPCPLPLSTPTPPPPCTPARAPAAPQPRRRARASASWRPPVSCSTSTRRWRRCMQTRTSRAMPRRQGVWVAAAPLRAWVAWGGVGHGVQSLDMHACHALCTGRGQLTLESAPPRPACGLLSPALPCPHPRSPCSRMCGRRSTPSGPTLPSMSATRQTPRSSRCCRHVLPRRNAAPCMLPASCEPCPCCRAGCECECSGAAAGLCPPTPSQASHPVVQPEGCGGF